ncbi:MAG: DUF853 family protein, partial [Burkholderiales bacterium]
EQRKALIAGSLVAGVYEKAVDRESAYEALVKRTAESQESQGTKGAPTGLPNLPGAAKKEEGGGFMGGLSDVLFGSTGPRGGQRDGLVQQVIKSEARNLARQVLRGALGGILGGKRR